MNQANNHPVAENSSSPEGLRERPSSAVADVPSQANPLTSPSMVDQDAEFAREVLDAESQAIQRIEITPAFGRAVAVILDATTSSTDGSGQAGGGGSVSGAGSGSGGGSVVVSGLGKSGLIGQKISATLASTGTPSHFLHPSEAMHGDLGRVRRGDVVLILSFGGSTDEVVSLASILKQDQVQVISIVGKPDCDLARLSTVALSIGDVTEACPHNLAPTASTTAMLALGDALAMSVSRRRNFGVDDFRKVHPGGALGRQLMPVIQAMRFRVGDNVPLVPLDATVQQAVQAEVPSATSRRVGAVLIVDGHDRLAGIFTDADLRRLLVQQGQDALQQPIKAAMTANPRRLTDDALVRDAVRLVREYRIDEIPVVDAEGKPLGLIDVQDLIALKVIED